MSSSISAMAIVWDKFEAQRALELLAAEKNFVILALSISAEYYIAQKLPFWRNQIYSLVAKDGARSSRYVFENFTVSYNFCNGTNYKYVRDRLGYFLAELERSLNLAKKAIKKYRPRLLIIGSLKNYPGSSVVDGTLKTNAFYLLAKEKEIPYRLIGNTKKSFSLRQTIGKKIQLLRNLDKQEIRKECDLLILATPRHLIQMASEINEIKRRGVNLTILTYNVTLTLKKDLDKNFPLYLEKERLVDSKIRKDARKAQKRLRRDKPWNKFGANKYKKNSVVINYIKWKIQDIVKNETSEIFTDILLAEKVLSKLNPKALLVTTDPDSKILPYIDKAKESGIKTICIQHGAFYGKDSPAIYPVSDFFIAWSNMSKSWLQRTYYFKKVKILVGRSPFHHFDDSSKNTGKSTKFTILYLSTKQPTAEKGLVMLYQRKLFDTLSKLDINFILLVRVHPYQEMSNLKSLIENFSHEAIFANDSPLQEVIGKSDLVIYENTTAGFDAMLDGKPTIYFNPYSGEDFFNVKTYNASFTILNHKDLEFSMPIFIKDQKRWQYYSKNGRVFAKKYLGIENSLNTSKLAEILVKLTQGK